MNFTKKARICPTVWSRAFLFMYNSKIYSSSGASTGLSLLCDNPILTGQTQWFSWFHDTLQQRYF